MGTNKDRGERQGDYTGFRSTINLVWVLLFSTLLQATPACAAEEHNNTPLMVAAHRADLAAMRGLLDRGADPSARNLLGATPLMFAAAARPADDPSAKTVPATIQLLLDRGAKVNAQTNNGRTALIDAAANGNPESVRLLLAAGADVNARTRSGDTPLLEATARGYTDIAFLLLQSGARTEDVNANGQTPLMLAIGQAPQYSQQKSPYEPIALALLQRGANPNVHDRNGQTPLSLVATGDKTVLAYPLLEHKAEVNVTDPTAADATPLIIAARHGNVPLVKVLLRYKADVARRDRLGETALGYAKKSGYSEISSLLMQAGANE